MKTRQITLSLLLSLSLALFVSRAVEAKQSSSKFAQQDKRFSAWKGKNGKEYENEIETEQRYTKIFPELTVLYKVDLF